MKKKTTEARKSTIDFLEKLFDELNTHFYAGELIRPEVTMQIHSTHKILGWCSRRKIWKTDGDENYELNVCPEHLANPFSDIINTMLHEMAHLYAAQKGIQDCSRSSTYHNKQFAEIASAHGLMVAKSAKSGYSITELAQASTDWINQRYPGIEKFDVYRSFTTFGSVGGGGGDGGKAGDGREDGNSGEDEGGKGGGGTKKKSRSIKYACPICGAIARATKKINITCTDCQTAFIEN